MKQDLLKLVQRGWTLIFKYHRNRILTNVGRTLLKTVFIIIFVYLKRFYLPECSFENRLEEKWPLSLSGVLDAEDFFSGENFFDQDVEIAVVLSSIFLDDGKNLLIKDKIKSGWPRQIQKIISLHQHF